MALNNVNILVAVTGGIAAYKCPEVIRRLTEYGASIQVVMTESAREFVKPLVFQAVSGNAVHVDLLDDQAEAGMGHIELARWADVVLIVPATANTLARMACGVADDLLSTICLATRSPVIVAPAMNSVMWEHPATQANLKTLQSRGIILLAPEAGSQACGETGIGRLMEPEKIVESLKQMACDGGQLTMKHVAQSTDSSLLKGVKVLLTAGPTREAIDPVRFISNHSSGKMGFALARAATDAGAEVTLIAGPVKLETPGGVKRIDVSSALQMHEIALSIAGECDIFISVAAVADYRVDEIKAQKIKKTGDDMTLTLIRNPDILADVASMETKPFCVGFAAETENLDAYARGKLQKKNLDMIVGNLVGVQSSGFNSDTNAVDVFWGSSGHVAYSSRSKESLATDLITLIASRYGERH
ncbi:phosphopantothenoylcysteine decarboxylase [Chromatiales bacterium (ex Bugula neritina AB1)]|nr:phosphopantothenoylcysteine decarboxylase [Chromatiales bacterium (ex Bugula neritina AB1)]